MGQGVEGGNQLWKTCNLNILRPANWNTLFEGGCKGGRGPGGGAFLFFGKSRLGQWFEGKGGRGRLFLS